MAVVPRAPRGRPGRPAPARPVDLAMALRAYPYLDASPYRIDFAALVSALCRAPSASLVRLGSQGPRRAALSPGQWDTVIDVLKALRHVLLLEVGSGGSEDDYAIRALSARNVPFLIAHAACGQAA